MKCPICTGEMVKAQATNFGEEYDFCRVCRKELSEIQCIQKNKSDPKSISYYTPPMASTPNIKVGDWVECLLSSPGHYTKGSIYKVVSIDTTLRRIWTSTDDAGVLNNSWLQDKFKLALAIPTQVSPGGPVPPSFAQRALAGLPYATYTEYAPASKGKAGPCYVPFGGVPRVGNTMEALSTHCFDFGVPICNCGLTQDPNPQPGTQPATSPYATP